MADSKPELMSKKGYANYGKLFPAGTSVQCLEHFQQLIISGEFKKFDYGNKEKNLEKHGQEKPPLYEISNIKDFPIMLVCGKTDLLASPLDYERLNDELTSNGNTLEFKEYECGHIGLIMPEDKSITADVFNSILKVTDEKEFEVVEELEK